MDVVITGDIVNSRTLKSNEWIDILKDVLNKYGKEHQDWEIYRGDSFQLLIEAKKALRVVLEIKSSIIQISPLNVRMAIGLGEVSFRNQKVLESNGSAFVYSGECFDGLKKETLMIKSDYEELDRTLNLMFSLANLVMDYWKPVSAEIIKHKLMYPELKQTELADLLGKKSQASISEGLKRGGYDELENMINYYEEQIIKL